MNISSEFLIANPDLVKQNVSGFIQDGTMVCKIGNCISDEVINFCKHQAGNFISIPMGVGLSIISGLFFGFAIYVILEKRRRN